MNPAIITGLISIGKEFIEDKDKSTEFAYKAMDKLLGTTTYRWVDALVKLSYASEQITKGLLRPIGAACMTAFGMYCHFKGIDLGASAIVYDGALPAWGVSRHVEKSKTPKNWDSEDYK